MDFLLCSQHVERLVALTSKAAEYTIGYQNRHQWILNKINATKKLSQNFIMDPRLLDRFARLASPSGKLVVEVGPGPGGITRSILGQGARRCIAVEKDHRFLPALEVLNEASGGRLEVVHGDVMNRNDFCIIDLVI